MVDKMWQRYGKFDVAKLTMPQIKRIVEIINNVEEREGLESQKGEFLTMSSAYHADEKNAKRLLRKINGALKANEYERKKRIGYKFKGRILSSG